MQDGQAGQTDRMVWLEAKVRMDGNLTIRATHRAPKGTGSYSGRPREEETSK